MGSNNCSYINAKAFGEKGHERSNRYAQWLSVSRTQIGGRDIIFALFQLREL
jgi:hypothetical protein